MEDYNPKDGNYEMFITNIEDDTAYCEVIDNNIERSHMEIPIGDLEKACGHEVKPGLIFKVIVANQGESINFKHIKRAPVSKGEAAELVQHYKDKYRDV